MRHTYAIYRLLILYFHFSAGLVEFNATASTKTKLLRKYSRNLIRFYLPD